MNKPTFISVPANYDLQCIVTYTVYKLIIYFNINKNQYIYSNTSIAIAYLIINKNIFIIHSKKRISTRYQTHGRTGDLHTNHVKRLMFLKICISSKSYNLPACFISASAVYCEMFSDGKSKIRTFLAVLYHWNPRLQVETEGTM